MMTTPDDLRSGDALIIVDLQNDFCPGGALPIENGDAIVAVVNEWIAGCARHAVPVVASRDWHPVGHVSFEESGGPWPVHCVQDSDGARFHPDLALPADAVVVTKGVRFDQDQSSVFDQTGLASKLRSDGVERLWVAGLAQDVCVLATVLDARKAGFAVNVLMAATRAVTPQDAERANQQMRDAGALLV